MKRVFILGSPKFPRGSAGANYDQHVALALKDAGWKVIILGKGINRDEDFCEGKYVYKGIEYKNEPETFKVKYGVNLAFYKQMSKHYTISKDDYFIIRDLGWLPQLWLSKKLGTEHMAYVHFETLNKDQFRGAIINPQYWCSKLKWGFKFNYIKMAFPISEALESEERNYGCKCLRIPVMIDPYEFGEDEKEKKPEVLKFIYPGAKLNNREDNIELLLESFASLTEEEKRKIELHITGATAEKLKDKLGVKSYLLENMKGLLVIHEWLEYQQLIELYRNMDFLVLVRFKNDLTIANFPSKVPETMNFGIIPICTRVGDYTRDYLYNNENSLIFEPDSIESCISALRVAISMDDNEYLRLRRAVRNTAIDRFGYKNWSDRISDFLLTGEEKLKEN